MDSVNFMSLLGVQLLTTAKPRKFTKVKPLEILYHYTPDDLYFLPSFYTGSSKMSSYPNKVSHASKHNEFKESRNLDGKKKNI